MTTTPRSMLRTVLGWPNGGQQQARRNALAASTALAQRRHERLEVERFLDDHARRDHARRRSALRADGLGPRTVAEA